MEFLFITDAAGSGGERLLAAVLLHLHAAAQPPQPSLHPADAFPPVARRQGSAA